MRNVRSQSLSFSAAQEGAVEEERRIRRDGRRRAALAVRELRGDAQCALATHSHPLHTHVPTLDHLRRFQGWGEGLATDGMERNGGRGMQRNSASDQDWRR